MIEEPSTVALAFALEDVQRIGHARILLDTGVSEVVERTEDVIVIPRRKGKFQEFQVRELAGREPATESTLQQVLFASSPCGGDLRRGSDGTLVLEQPLQHASRRME